MFFTNLLALMAEKEMTLRSMELLEQFSTLDKVWNCSMDDR